MIWNQVNVPLFYLANVLCKNSAINTIQAWKMEIVVHRMTTAEPGLSGTVLYCHPVLSNWLSKFWICLPLITVIFTSIMLSLSPFTDTMACFYCFPPVLNGHWKRITPVKLIIVEIIFNPCLFPKIKVNSISCVSFFMKPLICGTCIKRSTSIKRSPRHSPWLTA